ncbi:MAG: T9SS type A sorting domain-containing protein [Flavobacteriaceae bacterium]
MKKHYIFTFLIIVFLTLSSTLNAQVRFTKIDPSANTVTIYNYGTTMVNVSNYQLCHLFSYQKLSTLNIDSGSLTLVAGGDLSLSGFTINNSASDLGLYIDNNFASSTSMLDFFQWGSNGNGRESVAVSKGIWATGDFNSTSGPYFYNGNGTQNGITFWSNTVLSLEDITFSNNTFVYPNPVKDILNIKNSTSQLIISAELFDILGKRVSFKNYKLNNTLDLSNLSRGIYYIRLASDKGAISFKKIIKN